MSVPFVSKLSDDEGEAAETQTWLEFAVKSGYLPSELGRDLFRSYNEVIAMLVSMINRPDMWILPSCRNKRSRD